MNFNWLVNHVERSIHFCDTVELRWLKTSQHFRKKPTRPLSGKIKKGKIIQFQSESKDFYSRLEPIK
ncbi:CLUMA_CG002871, isoform A [Clunio marinus]|uniref:CLUMA_CG002871, isoform A n=1 Tax=Clunio marinus TaxID=568069 RepID=A0A1J1HRA3_9DIPT|nr:CLUMA_CG002871, isoform A [Clunio marinus]